MPSINLGRKTIKKTITEEEPIHAQNTRIIKEFMRWILNDSGYSVSTGCPRDDIGRIVRCENCPLRTSFTVKESNCSHLILRSIAEGMDLD